jgi:hypothetical protein
MADQKKLGASPSERKRITSNRMSDSLKKSKAAKRKSNLTGKTSGSPIKGEMDRDLARLKKMKADAKKFEAEVIGKKRAQTSKLKDPLIERAKKSIAKYDRPKNKVPVSKVQKKDAKALSKGRPKMGFTSKGLSIKGASGPAGKRLKRI